MQKIANSNFHYFRYAWDYFLKQQQENGCKQILLWGSVPHLWVDHLGYEDLTGLKERLAAHEIRIFAYMPRTYNISMFAEAGSAQQEASKSYFENSIEIADELDSAYVLIDLAGALKDADPEAQLANCAAMLRHICSKAAEKGLTVAVGTVTPDTCHLVNRLPELQELIRRVGAENLKVVLDICAMAEAGETIAEWFAAFGSSICAVILADGRTSGYYALGDGCYPIASYLKQLEALYDGVICLRMDRDRYERKPLEADAKNFAALKKLGCNGGN